MLARPPQIHPDMMHPTNSYLLAKALSEFLPEECYTKQPVATFAPAGHHLVYFPLHLLGSELCPDGTDPYHSPVPPQNGGGSATTTTTATSAFTRRMWAGGSIRGIRGLRLDGGPALCVERIVDVSARGADAEQQQQQQQKIFVEVLREYIPGTNPAPIRARDGVLLDGITERRTLVFMRELSDEQKKMNLEQKQRVVKAPKNPDYAVTLTPTPTLLFHYSALTYNAHRIHLDRSYCREDEGHRDLLVHGPLSLTLMLSVLQSRLSNAADGKGKGESISAIEYRHLAPLYVGLPMRVCVARQGKSNNKWDLWVENQDGGLCVRGTAETHATTDTVNP